MRALAAALALSLLAAPLRAADGKEAVLIGRIVGSGKPVYLNDHVTTGPSDRLQIRLRDDTLFTIGPNSSLVIDEFVYDPSTGLGKVTTKVLTGIFEFISGKVGKKRPESMKVILPACTIGINGTAVIGKVEPGRDTVVLKSGAIDVSNSAGQVRLAQAAYAVTVDAGQTPSRPFASPTLLASLMKALAPEKPGAKSAAGPVPETGRSCSRLLEKTSPQALLSFKSCVRRKASGAGLAPESLVHFEEIVDALEKLGDAALAAALKKVWLEQLRLAKPGPWRLEQETPADAFVRPGDAEAARAAKKVLAARYRLSPAAMARLERVFIP